MILPPGRRVKSSSESSSSHHHAPLSECLSRCCCLSTLSSFCFVFARQKRNGFKSKRVLLSLLRSVFLSSPKRRERESFDSVIKTREEKLYSSSSSLFIIKRILKKNNTHTRERERCVFLRNSKGRKSMNFSSKKSPTKKGRKKTNFFFSSSSFHNDGWRS